MRKLKAAGSSTRTCVQNGMADVRDISKISEPDSISPCQRNFQLGVYHMLKVVCLVVCLVVRTSNADMFRKLSTQDRNFFLPCYW